MTDTTSSNNKHYQMTYIGLLQVILVALKLAGVTRVSDWSWWQVFLPTIIDLSLTMVALAVLIAIKCKKR